MHPAHLAAWERENVQPCWFDDPEGRLVPINAPPVTSFNVGWLVSHRFGYVVEDNGQTLRFDDDHVYVWYRDLGEPFAAYGRVPTT